MNGKEFGTKTSWPIPGIIRAFFSGVTEESHEMSDEWEGIWNEDVVAYSRYYPGIF